MEFREIDIDRLTDGDAEETVKGRLQTGKQINKKSDTLYAQSVHTVS